MKKFVPSMVAASLLAALISYAWTGLSAAGAAEDDNVEFEDNFESLDPGWGEGSSSYGVKEGKVFIALEPQTLPRRSTRPMCSRNSMPLPW